VVKWVRSDDSPSPEVSDLARQLGHKSRAAIPVRPGDWHDARQDVRGAGGESISVPMRCCGTDSPVAPPPPVGYPLIPPRDGDRIRTRCKSEGSRDIHFPSFAVKERRGGVESATFNHRFPSRRPNDRLPGPNPIYIAAASLLSARTNSPTRRDMRDRVLLVRL
jgi:hypothetical protein